METFTKNQIKSFPKDKRGRTVYPLAFKKQIVVELKSLGHGGQTKLAEKYGLHPSVISQWSRKVKIRKTRKKTTTLTTKPNQDQTALFSLIEELVLGQAKERIEAIKAALGEV